jgi:hypothetical protein
VSLRFEKRQLQPQVDTTVLWAYNEGATRRCVGPGYVTAHEDGDEVLVDYTNLPPGWPAGVPNSRGLSLVVFTACRIVGGW